MVSLASVFRYLYRYICYRNPTCCFGFSILQAELDNNQHNDREHTFKYRLFLKREVAEKSIIDKSRNSDFD